MGLKLGDISPLAGVITGKGALGGLQDFGGLIPALINGGKDDTNKALAEAELKKEEMQKEEKAKKMLGMKKGGKVSSASKRADGCAIRGKTRA
jgi:hypothetical protein